MTELMQYSQGPVLDVTQPISVKVDSVEMYALLGALRKAGEALHAEVTATEDYYRKLRGRSDLLVIFNLVRRLGDRYRRPAKEYRLSLNHIEICVIMLPLTAAMQEGNVPASEVYRKIDQKVR